MEFALQNNSCSDEWKISVLRKRTDQPLNLWPNLFFEKMPQQVYPERELEESRKDRSELNLSNNRDQQTRNELSEQLSQTFGPTLFVMKLAGDFFGETTLTEPRDLNSNWGNSAYCISRFYSSFVVLAEWLLVVLGLITLFIKVWRPWMFSYSC